MLLFTVLPASESAEMLLLYSISQNCFYIQYLQPLETQKCCYLQSFLHLDMLLFTVVRINAVVFCHKSCPLASAPLAASFRSLQ